MLRQSPNQPVRKTVMTINNINMDDQGNVDIENTIKNLCATTNSSDSLYPQDNSVSCYLAFNTTQCLLLFFF